MDQKNDRERNRWIVKHAWELPSHPQEETNEKRHDNPGIFWLHPLPRGQPKKCIPIQEFRPVTLPLLALAVNVVIERSADPNEPPRGQLIDTSRQNTACGN